MPTDVLSGDPGRVIDCGELTARTGCWLAADGSQWPQTPRAR